MTSTSARAVRSRADASSGRPMGAPAKISLPVTRPLSRPPEPARRHQAAAKPPQGRHQPPTTPHKAATKPPATGRRPTPADDDGRRFRQPPYDGGVVMTHSESLDEAPQPAGPMLPGQPGHP